MPDDNKSNERMDIKKIMNSKDKLYDLFKEKKAELNELIQKSKNIDSSLINEHFSSINKKFNELYAFLRESSYRLPAYSLRSWQNQLQELKQIFQNQQDFLKPNQKFSFSQRKKLSLTPKLDVPLVEDTTCNTPFCYDPIHECGFNNKENVTLDLYPDQLNDKNVILSELKNCVIRLYGLMAALQLVKLNQCTIYGGPVKSSIFINDCLECTCFLAGQQIRLYNSSICKLYLFVTSSVILEDSKDICIGPYNWNYDALQNDFANSGLDVNHNNWNNVKDFNWPSTMKPSPNWCILQE